MEEPPLKPSHRILLFDIETSPNIGFTWGKWEQNVIKFIREWEFLCYSYKWLDEPSIHCVRRDNFNKESEIDLIKKLWKLFDEANVIVAHNGDAFDNKKSKTKFLQHIGRPPSPWKTVDTKKIAKSQFAFNGNSLGELAEFFGVGKKMETGGFELWEGVMADDEAAWEKMCLYNKHDIFLLEKVYLHLRPWMPNHPNVALLEEKKNGCPNCGSTELNSEGYLYLASGKKKPRLSCKACGKWSSGKAAFAD